MSLHGLIRDARGIAGISGGDEFYDRLALVRWRPAVFAWQAPKRLEELADVTSVVSVNRAVAANLEKVTYGSAVLVDYLIDRAVDVPPMHEVRLDERRSKWNVSC